MMKILITAIGGDIGSAIARCIRNNITDVYIIGCDINKINQGLEYIDIFYEVPKYIADNYLEELKSIVLKEKIDIIIPVTEPEIELMNLERSFFNTNNIKMLINNSFIINTFLNKYSTAEYLKEIGLHTPESISSDDYFNGKLVPTSWPVIVKNNKGCGSRNVVVAHNLDELDRIVLGRQNFIIQEYIDTDDDEFTVGIFSDGCETKTIAFRRKLEENGGMTVLVETVADFNIIKIAEKISRSTALIGCINVQMRMRDGEYYIFEVNPRISGTVGFRDKIGFKDLLWWIKYCNKEIIDYSTYNREKKYIGVKKYDEFVFESDKEFKNSKVIHISDMLSTKRTNVRGGAD